MKSFIFNFLPRGLVACGFGPITFAVVFLILKQTVKIDTLTVPQMCIGIFSTAALAFIAGGMNAIYQIERLPLMGAILIHGIVLYASYLFTYLINDWLVLGVTPILVFTAIFIVGYFMIWGIVYFISKKNTENLNKILQQKQQTATKE